MYFLLVAYTIWPSIMVDRIAASAVRAMRTIVAGQAAGSRQQSATSRQQATGSRQHDAS